MLLLESESEKSATKITTRPFKRPPIFEFPALPKWETYYYIAFLAIGSAVVYPKIYFASRDYKWTSQEAEYVTNELPFFGTRRKDRTNYEWTNWLPYMWQVLPWFIGHSLLFNLSEKFLSRNQWSVTMLVYWLIGWISLFRLWLVGAALLLGLAMFTVMRVTRNKKAVWMASVAFLYTSFHLSYELPIRINHYMTIGFLSYKMLQYISYCQDECEMPRPENKNIWIALYNMYWYAFYMPYSLSLVVLYRHVPVQLEQRSRPRDYRNMVTYALRILFWGCLIEFLLNFLYFDAIATDPIHMNELRQDSMLMIAYAAGQFFQMKYLIIFGFPAVFAKFDNMQPPKGPICIARVPLYSKIWRAFDRGLYDFFKEYIFLPICRPTFSLSRKIFGVLLSYGFVLIWHGLEHQYIVWIILNIVELFIETFAKAIYLIPTVKQWREANISDQWFRRIIAFLTACPWAFGAYANFYFVTTSEVAYVIVDRIFWKETVTFQWPFAFLVFGSYHLTQVCIDVDRWLVARESKKKGD